MISKPNGNPTINVSNKAIIDAILPLFLINHFYGVVFATKYKNSGPNIRITAIHIVKEYNELTKDIM